MLGTFLLLFLVLLLYTPFSTNVQQCQQHVVTLVTKFSMLVSSIFSIINSQSFLSAKICISSDAPSKKQQITVRFGGHSRSTGPEYGTCFMSLFWYLKFGGGLQPFAKFVDLWSVLGYYDVLTDKQQCFRDVQLHHLQGHVV